MKVKPNPFVLTFDDEADGGPKHLLSLLTEFYLSFRKDGKVVASGQLNEVLTHTVLVQEWNADDSAFTGTIHALLIDTDFDEVVYH